MLLNPYSRLVSRVNVNIFRRHNNFRLVSNVSHPTETKDIDAPVKYSASPARHWKASTSRLGYKNTRLWYEPYVILASLTVFMVYFGILREENDVDEELKKSLYSRIQGLEEHQLKVSLEFNREHNLETAQIIQRLEEIEREKEVAK